MSEWISVDERLPAKPSSDVVFEAIEYLVTDGYDVSLVDFQRGDGCGNPWAEWGSYGPIMKSKITHWMPLPEPPK